MTNWLIAAVLVLAALTVVFMAGVALRRRPDEIDDELLIHHQLLPHVHTEQELHELQLQRQTIRDKRHAWRPDRGDRP